ncbi:MAG: hypothetical protein WA610_10585, partial [Thermodesulfovibrionales bacterium]
MGKASRRKQALSSDVRKDEKGHPAAPAPPRGEGFFTRSTGYLLLIGIVGFLAYSNTFKGPFQWDEAEYILNNPVIRDLGYFLSPSKVEGSWLYYILKSRYIGYLTFALNYRLHGYDVFGYHIFNLAIHIINAILVYFLILLTFRTPYFRGLGTRDQGPGKQDLPVPDFQSRVPNFFALAVALLFVAHPLQTEAVTYVFQRLASLMSLFYLLSVVLYIKGRLSAISSQQSAENSRFTILWYVLSLLAAVLAMKTKENAFTLPVIIALYEFLFFTGQLKTRMLRLLPFFLTMLIIPMTIFGTGSSAGELMAQIKDPQALGYQELSRGDYLFTQFRVVVTYIRLLLFPANQNIDYEYPLYHSLFDLPVLFSFFFLLALFGAAIWLLYRSRPWARGHGQEDIKLSTIHYSLFTIHCFCLIGFGILWFFITLSVESSVIPIPMVINEYRIYLPSVGFFLALVAGLGLLLRQSSRFTIHDSRFMKVVAALFTVIILALASATFARNTLWKDKVSLWEDVVRKSPYSSRGYNNLGIA